MRDTFQAADLSQPSVYHQPAAGAAPTLPQDTQPLAREGSTFQRSARTQSITPSGVAALFAASESVSTQPTSLLGARTCRRCSRDAHIRATRRDASLTHTHSPQHLMQHT